MAKAAHDTMTATELVRNLSAAIDRVRVTGYSLYITKGAQTVAELKPPPKSGLPINRLAVLLNSLPKSGDDAATMSRDLERIRHHANLPENPWG